MIVKVIDTSFSLNIFYTFILLLLLVLDNNVHSNPGPREHEFSVFHLNARSVRNKISYIEDIAFESSVICITESHLDNKVSNSDMVIDGFSCDIFRKDRSCFVGFCMNKKTLLEMYCHIKMQISYR